LAPAPFDKRVTWALAPFDKRMTLVLAPFDKLRANGGRRPALRQARGERHGRRPSRPLAVPGRQP
jgi:hypothetical protein